MSFVKMEELEGLVFSKIVEGDDEIKFFTDDGDVYTMHHLQDFCESVTLEEVIGDFEDLLGTPILESRESSSGDRKEAEMDLLDGEDYVMMKLKTFSSGSNDVYAAESETWTFYNFRTIKGSVTLRWYGTSNGYYSESVYITKE